MLIAEMCNSPRAALVQRLDILQDVLEAPATRGDFMFCQRVEHEGVIGIRAVPERQERGVRHEL